MSSVYGGPMGARDDDYDNQDEYTNSIMDKIRELEKLHIPRDLFYQYCSMLLNSLAMVDEMIQPVRNDVEQIKKEMADKKPKTAFTLFTDAFEVWGTRYGYATEACDNMLKWLREYGELNVGPVELAKYWEDYLSYERHVYEWRDPHECDMEDFAKWLSEQEL